MSFYITESYEPTVTISIHPQPGNPLGHDNKPDKSPSKRNIYAVTNSHSTTFPSVFLTAAKCHGLRIKYTIKILSLWKIISLTKKLRALQMCTGSYFDSN